jgi:NRAMP (natural resistance-associated macrophage protein)-like metal ion transporter
MADEFIQKVAESPAIALERTIRASRRFTNAVSGDNYLRRAKQYWHNLGPGLTTGAADDDPSGIATYSQTGAQYGFGLLWLSLFTFPFMSIVQEMCARIGLVTGMGLASNIRKHFPRKVLYTCSILLFVANTLNIGADIGAMAKAAQLVVPIHSAWLVIGFTLFCLLIQIFTTYNQFARYLKYLALVLLSYVLTAMVVNIDWKDALMHTVIPSITFSKEQIFLICAILGTTISPYLFFWQTSQEVEDEILQGKVSLASRQRETTPHDISKMRVDVWSGMFVSNLVMFFIIAATAATLHASGIHNITTAADAAAALRPLAGDQAYLLFTLGIIGTGILAVPVLAGSASYALSESFGWKFGLYRKLEHAYSFYGVIIISMLIGLAINFTNFDPIKALIYSAVVNGLIAPIVLILILLISSNKKIMGEWVNKPHVTVLGWIITLVMIAAGIAAIVSLVP